MFFSSFLSIFSLLFATALAAKAPAFRDRDQGGDDPYPVRQYVGSKQPLTGASRYPQAMTHDRDRNGPNSNNNGRPIPKQTHFEPLFDDFPGPKTKQRIYYPGKGYVNMQVPVQQPDPYTDGKAKPYQSGAYDSSSDSNYDQPAAPQRSYSPPSYSSRPQAQPSYSAPAQQPSYSAAAPTDYSHEDDDSPFDYLAKKGSSNGGYQAPAAPAYRPSAPAYRPSAPAPAYRPSPPAPTYKSNYQPQTSYRPPSPAAKPSYPSGGAGYSAGSGYDGGDDSSEVKLTSYNPPVPSNPSGYTPTGAYPSTYPDNKAASTYSQTAAEPFGAYGMNQQDSPVDGLSSSFGPRSYFESGRAAYAGNDAHERGFYDLAEQQSAGNGPQAGPFKK